ncbi:MAG: M48 family metalloprotease [Candidatus Aceula meridiana]|nr:M48 family metalloprotease [Candidatus Aceula meridiana]
MDFFFRNKIYLRLFLFLSLLFFTGCATLGTYNSATERNEIVFLSTSSEVSIGNDLQEKISSEYPLSKDIQKIQRLEGIGRRLAAVSDRQDYEYKFYLVEKDELNAFTIPGGRIYFLTGLFDKLETDDAIAAVVAHEIGHCAARHIAKKFQASLGYSVVSAIAFQFIPMNNGARQIASLSAGAAMTLVFTAFSRKDEYQADALSIKYMYLAGYSLDGIINAFELLERESKGPKVPLWLRTHPYIEDRIKVIKKEIPKAQAKYSHLRK